MSTTATPSVKLVVGMADLKVSSSASDQIITYALGSCLGVVVYDAVAGVGGMLHVMMPESQIDPRKAAANPYMFVDTGIPQLFKQCYALGAKKERLEVRVAGGAYQGEDESADRFQIGKRNFIALRKLLWKNGVMIKAHDVGGVQRSRTMDLAMGTGDVTVKCNGVAQAL
jgi:chemotaxis protein CheD